MTYAAKLQKIIRIAKVEHRTSQNGKMYQLVTDSEDGIWSIWDGGINVEVNKTYAVTYEENTRGDKTYRTIKEAVYSPSAEAPTAQSKDDVWAKKDQLSARQTSINCASNIVAAQIGAGTKYNGDVTKEILRIGRELYQYVYFGDTDWVAEDTEAMISNEPF